MSRIALTSLLLAALAAALAQAQGGADLAVVAALKQADRSLIATTIWRRVHLTPALDLVLAIGAPAGPPLGDASDRGHWWWDESRKLGVFLQARTQPYRVSSLAIAPGPPECAARIVRATATDTVVACTGEKSAAYPSRKFVYDVGARRLVGQFSYEPLTMYRALRRDAPVGALIIGANKTQHVVVDFVPDRLPAFRVAATRPRLESDHTSAIVGDTPVPLASPPFGPLQTFRLIPVAPPRDELGPEMVVQERIGRGRLYPLPRSTYAEFANARPGRVQDGYGPETRLNDRIGPWEVDDTRLWFGKTFYDGEGYSGIGGFGYFDAREREFRTFTPPAVSDWSVSAMSVQRDAVWLALVSRGEWGDRGGGLVRFDRASETFERFEIDNGVGFQFVPAGGHLVLATTTGMTLVRQSDLRHYFVDRATDGQLRVVAADR